MIPLGLLNPGEQGEIVEIRFLLAGAPAGGERSKGDTRVEDMGLRVGKRVQMLNNGSPILLKIDESRIAVDRGMAMKIMIREVGK